MMEPDFTLYLVTDSTPQILKDNDLITQVKLAIEGGVSFVQYRDKISETAHLVVTARKLLEITRPHKIPLLINDRIDVALAVGADGVHIGQEDMDVTTARRLLGEQAIIGVTASSVDEAIRAARDGADYLGLGTVYATPTKENAKSIQGPSGVRAMLAALVDAGFPSIKTVCIGGINQSNVQQVMFKTSTASKTLDGVAVVSAIMGAADPSKAASELRSLLSTAPPYARDTAGESFSTDASERLLVHDITAPLVRKLAESTPLNHNMTNLVVQNFAANVALCIGSSPIMSSNGAEASDLARLGGSLVVNMGTVTPEMLKNYSLAVQAYNKVGGPIVLDPVGAGATQARKEAIQAMLNLAVFDVIKGNENEIKTVAGVTKHGEQQRGVDSGNSDLTPPEKARIVRNLANSQRAVVLMTGVTDILSDGNTTLAISNGHEYLGAITGSGCCLGTTIAAYLAIARGQRLSAALAAILHYEIAAERAASSPSVCGPGTFVPAFLDELYAIRRQSEEGDHSWLDQAKVSLMRVPDGVGNGDSSTEC